MRNLKNKPSDCTENLDKGGQNGCACRNGICTKSTSKFVDWTSVAGLDVNVGMS